MLEEGYTAESDQEVSEVIEEEVPLGDELAVNHALRWRKEAQAAEDRNRQLLEENKVFEQKNLALQEENKQLRVKNKRLKKQIAKYDKKLRRIRKISGHYSADSETAPPKKKQKKRK